MTRAKVSESRLKAIERILLSWFDVRGNKIDIKNDFLRVKSWQLLKKYGQDTEYNDFAQDFISKCFDILLADSLNFTDHEWEKAGFDSIDSINIFSDNRKSAKAKGQKVVEDGTMLAKLSSYVSKSIVFSYQEEKEKYNSIRIRNGLKNGYTLIKLDLENIEGTMTDEGGSSQGQVDKLTQANSLYNTNEAITSHYYRWYLSNKDKMLSAKQLNFINGWSAVDYIDVTDDERVEATGVIRANFNYYLKAIATKILKQYNEERPIIHTPQQLKMLEFCELVEPLIDIYEDDSDDMNEKMFDYLFEHYHLLQQFVNLTDAEHVRINQRRKDSKILYIVFNQLKKRYDSYVEALENVERITENLIQFKKQSTTINHFQNIEKGAKYANITGKDGYATVVDETQREEMPIKIYMLDELVNQ